MTTQPIRLRPPATEPAARLVLLGASNLLRGLPMALAAARRRLAFERLEVWTALGHGRSYGLRSRILGRALPGIVDCRLWRDLERRSPAPTWALVTDIGNDIAYGASPAEIVAWIATCVDRLQQLEARIVLTSLPVPSLDRLKPWQIALARRLLFPSSRVIPTEIRERVHELDQRLRELADRHALAFVELPREWYGIDPIHFRRRALRTAWEAMLAPWSEGEAAPLGVTSVLDGLRLRCLVPDERWLFGVHQHGRQPAGQLQGCPLWLY